MQYCTVRKNLAASGGLARLRQVAETTSVDARRSALSIVKYVGGRIALVDRSQVGVGRRGELREVRIEATRAIGKIGDEDINQTAQAHVVDGRVRWRLRAVLGDVAFPTG